MSLLLLFLGAAAGGGGAAAYVYWFMMPRWVAPPVVKAPNELVTPHKISPFEITTL